MNSQSNSMKLSFVEKFGYGLGDTASNFVWALMMNFIMFYYTDIFGITAAAAGTMLLFARSTDGVVDFFIGAIADRTKSKWGRFRPYLVWLCVPLAIAFVLAFTTPRPQPRRQARVGVGHLQSADVALLRHQHPLRRAVRRDDG